MFEAFSDLLASASANPWLIALLLTAFAFVFEDAALITAGLLLGAGTITAPIAFGTIYTGIISGDMMIYGIGRLARGNAWSRRMIGPRRLVQGRRWLRRRLIPSLVSARLTPGMRLATFAASGFLGIRFWPFFCVVAAMAGVWTASILCVVFFSGELVARVIGDYVWIVGLVLALGTILLPYGLWLLRARREKLGRSS